MQINGNILFKEAQQFRVKWLWWLVVLCMLSAVGLTVGLMIATPQKTNEAWIALVIVVPFEAAILYLFYITRLETIISTEGIYLKWWPFQRNYSFIAAADVKQAYFRNGPLMSYGFHWHFGYGRVHNMGPGKGVQLILKKGKKIFLGTQKLPAFQTAVEKIMTVTQQV